MASFDKAFEQVKQIATAKTEGDKDFLENKCNSLDS